MNEDEVYERILYDNLDESTLKALRKIVMNDEKTYQKFVSEFPGIGSSSEQE